MWRRPPGRNLLGRRPVERNLLRFADDVGRNEADLLRFVDHRRLPPFEGEVEKLLSRNGIGRAVGLKLVMDCRFETQARTTMPLDHATPLQTRPTRSDNHKSGRRFWRHHDQTVITSISAKTQT